MIDLISRNGFTPLHLAAKNGNYGVITSLIDAGANVDAKDK